ncbi:hemagglutinin repeat-containing protein [Paraburkholderia edwinii]|uniref:Hemagglutinin repeat-containing protein n=2 Tax=Paraburkholderia edwinii TaxID=2861782 RepID=A0ABX8UQ05_9BURK|nr:hemagglutinin repeat-containing protein [Paraburkholderia edwinii]
MLSMRHIAFAALCALGMQPLQIDAQVTAAPTSAGSKPIVGVTANGLPVVQIATPNGAGVSNNAYTQYNVGPQGLILNNSPGNVLTQQAGYVTGNPNLASGSARVILNQVIGGSPSQLLGYTEVAGQRAEVVIANPAGIYCNGCGFINTSRGILTTGTPVFGGTGSLDAFHVTGGQIQIGAAGLDGSQADQVDLIARSVAINGKAWAGQSLNVVAGNNDVRHDDLSAQWLGPDGNSPGVAIDVAQLGGMYAGKIRLVGTETGVGVNSAGTIASQAGDLQLNSQGKVSLSGTTSANGNVTISGAGDVANSGSVYATQNTAVNSQSQVDNSGTVAALGNTSITGASVNSTGALGAGVDANGNVTGAGSLAVTGAGSVSATGQQIAGGNLAMSGSSLNMAGSQTLAKGNVSLTATGAGGDTGNLAHTGAALQAGGSLTVNAASGDIDNTAGQLEAAGAVNVSAANVQNSAGRIVSDNTDGLTLTASGQITNAAGTTAQAATGGVIGGNGNVDIKAASLTNNGTVTAAQHLAVTALGTLDNSGGTLSGATLAANAASLKNANGAISANTVAMTVPQFDNSGGQIAANQLTVSASNLTNAHGKLTQLGSGAMGLDISGTLDNANGGVIQTNSTDLTLAPASLNNNGGTITHAGTGTLTIDTANGSGAVSNVGGAIVSNGRMAVSAGSVDNTGGSVTAAQTLDTTVAGALDNSGGTLSAQTVTTRAASFTNADGVVSGNSVSMTVPQLDNSNGKIIANQLDLTATNLTNERGSLTQLGANAMGFDVSNAIDNSNGGVIQTNSTDLSLASASINNNGGTITHAGAGTLTIEPGNGAGSLTNVGGRIVTNGLASVRVGSLDNTGGTLASQGAMSAIVQAVLNNTNGRLSSGSALTVSSGGALLNAGGVIGAGGAVTDSTLNVTAASIDNSGGAVTNVGTGATTINGGSQIVNRNAGGVAGMGSISGNGNVSLSASSVSNTQGGQLSGANLLINASNLDSSGGAIGNVANTSGDVGITTGTLNVTNGQINASRNLSVAASTLLGGGRYSAVNDLTLNLQGSFATDPNYSFTAGHNLTFTLPGTFSNAGAFAAVNGLTVNAGDIANSGTLAAGGLLSTHSNTLTNTGTIVGGSVSLSAVQTLSNLGTSALIGATDSAGKLELLSADIENRDDTTATDAQAMTAIYGLGQVVLAGGKDANGNYTNANLVRNQSGLIQSSGDMQIAANQVTNTRRAMGTSGFTSAVNPDLLASLGISLSGQTGQVGVKDPDSIGGVYVEPPHGGQWNSTYQFTTYTGVAVASTVTTISPESQIIAGGNLNAASVGIFQNYWSQVAAAGNIAMPAVLDQNSWQGQSAPQVQVTYSGQYHYNNYDNSEHDWQLPFGDAPFVGSRPGGYSQVAPADIRTYALPAYESRFTAGGTLSGTGVTINNTAGNASVTPLGLPPGQSVSGTGAGAVSGTISAHGGGSVQGGPSNFDNPTIAAATAGNVLSNITLPRGGLFSVNSAPNSPYLVETNPAFTSQQQWLSSDYYFQQMGMNPGQIQLRLGDGFYEQKLVQDQIMSMTGKSVLTNYADTQDEFKALMTSGAQLAQSLNLAPGTGLSPEQVAQLTSNVVIMQSQVVDGQTVLVPVVYLAQASQDNMGNGPVIAATNIDLQNAKSVTNSGTISAANNFSIGAQSIDSSFGTLQAGGQMALVTAGDINLTSATLNAGSLALQSGGNLILDTSVKTVSQVSDTGATRVTTTMGPAASINVAGNAVIVTGGDFEQNAGSLNVGGALGMSVGGDWNLGVQQTGEHKVVERANGVSDTDINQVVGSSVKVGGASLLAVGGDLTATGANMSLGGGGTIIAGGNVTLQAATATSTVDSNSSGTDHHGSYSETLHTSDDSLTATTLQSGDSLSVVSGKDINVTGSTVSLDKGNALLMAAGSVNVGAATETHVSDTYETHSHSGVASHTSAVNQVDQSATYADGSTISADGVSVISGKDINVTGSNIVGTYGVGLAAAGNVNILAATDTWQDSEYHQVKHSGLSGSGGIGFTIGSSEQSDRYNASSVTQSQSRSIVGSVEGNVVISAGKDVHIGGSDIVAGRAAGDVTGATGNIGIVGQNVTIDPSQDTAQSNDHQEQRSSGLTLAVTGTPLDTVRNLQSAGSSGNAYQRAQGVGNELTASGLDTPSVTATFSHSSSSSTTVVSSMSNAGSTIRGAGNVSVTATGGALRDANGNPLDGNIAVIGSTISAGGTTTLDANRNVILQASTNQLQQSTQSESSSTSFQLASPSPGDFVRWVTGGPNSSGVSSSPYNAGRGNADSNGSATTQTASVVSGNSVIVKSHTGDIDVVGSGISGTQGVDLIATQGAINVLAGTETSTNHEESSSHQFGDLGSNGTGTGFSQGVSNSHMVQDTAAQTQSTIRSQIVSGNGNVTLDAKQDVTVQGSDLYAGQDLTLIGKNLNLDPGTDAQQSSMSQSASQFGVTFALGGVAGDTAATVNRSLNQASHAGDSRLAALDVAQAALAVYNAPGAAASGQAPAVIKATVSVGGGTSHAEAQSSSTTNSGSTLTAGGTATLVATGSGNKDGAGYATDGDINARGTQITAHDVALNAARDINLQSAKDTSQQTSSNSSTNASIGVGFGLGGAQNGFTLELAANGAKGNANGNGTTNHDTQINASGTVAITSGRDTNLRGAEVAGNTVDANVGRDLNIQSVQDTNAYNSQQASAGFQASICVPPFCYGQTVSGSANASDQTIKDNFQSVNQQSGISAGSGGFDIYVGNHTQLDGGVIASTASPDKNSLSTQTLDYTNLQNQAEYSGSTVSFGVSTNSGGGTTGIAGMGPSGFGASGVSDDASGTTYAAVSPGTITVRGDAGTGHDSTAGLSRDTANANGSVANTFDAQNVSNDMAVQQGVVQVGMQVVGDIGRAEHWEEDSAARIASHAAVAALGAALGGGNVAGAVGGTVAGDIAGNAAAHAGGGALAGNIASGAAGALAGGALGGAGGAMSGANGALGADLYNRQLHPDEKQKLQQKANEIAANIAQNPQDQATIAQYWNSMLTVAASADVDTQAAQQLNAYVDQLTQAAQASGNYAPLDRFLSDLNIAQQTVQSMAGQPLYGTTGNPIVADGSVVSSFQSTPAQASDTTLFANGPLGSLNQFGPGNTLATTGWQPIGNATVQQQIQWLEQSTLQQASTLNGSVSPTYPLENIALGGMAGKIVSGVLGAIFDAAAANSAVVGSVANANFAQSSINAAEAFSIEGAAKYSQIAGMPINTVDDLAAAIKSGLISPSQLPVDYVVTADGTQLILNTRTSVALSRAGVPQSQWYGANQTGLQVPGMSAGTTFDYLAARQLARNKLPPTGTPNVPKGTK